MASFEEKIEQLVAPGPNRVASGVTFMVADKTGMRYKRSFGTTSVAPSSPPLTPDSVMRIKSSSKLVCSLAALQCVERGLLKLDEDASLVLPELKDLEVITGVDESTGLPITRKRVETITLRRLLSHTAGCTYPFLTPSVGKLMLKKNPNAGQERDDWEAWVNNPLLFEPGQGWHYGVGVEWSGRMVERVTGMDLDAYYQKHILAPLGVKDLAFRLDSRPDMKSRLIPAPKRTESGGLENPPEEPLRDPRVCMAGGGLFAAASSYFEIPRAVFNRDERLLKAETWDLITKPEIEHPTKPTSVADLFTNVQEAAPVPPGGLKYGHGHGLVSAIALTDVPGYTRKGALFWGGMLNDSWVVDYKAGLVTYLALQVDPYEDKEVAKLKSIFHQEMHKRFAQND